MMLSKAEMIMSQIIKDTVLSMPIPEPDKTPVIWVFRDGTFTIGFPHQGDTQPPDCVELDLFDADTTTGQRVTILKAWVN